MPDAHVHRWRIDEPNGSAWLDGRCASPACRIGWSFSLRRARARLRCGIAGCCALGVAWLGRN